MEGRRWEGREQRLVESLMLLITGLEVSGNK